MRRGDGWLHLGGGVWEWADPRCPRCRGAGEVPLLTSLARCDCTSRFDVREMSWSAAWRPSGPRYGTRPESVPGCC